MDYLSLYDEYIDEFIEMDRKDPNGYFATQEKIKNRLEKWFNRFELWLKTGNFDLLLEKLIKKNGSKRVDWCYSRGLMEYPTPLLGLLFEYLSSRFESVYNEKFDDNPFYSESYFFKGYWFVVLAGCGSCSWQIYDNEYKLIGGI